MADADRVSPASLLRRVPLAQGEGWSVHDCVCTAGPRDRRFEERHERMALALVLAGTFQYRTPAGQAVMYPGSYLLGNPDECFECGHTHSVGDRCVAIHASREMFEEVAASVAGSSRYRFEHPMLPARAELTAVATSLQVLQARLPSPGRVAAADIRRLSAALHHIETNSALPLRLGHLAAIATMSKYHFLRTFRRVTGSTPHRYLLATRLRRAAAAIAQSRQPISAIALDEGFNDLSSFNRYFRRMMHATPNQYRSSFRLFRLS
jgi:AraC family transcriptional regulator